MTIQPYEAPERLPATEPDEQARGWVVRLRAAAEIASYIGGTEFVPEGLRGRPEAITAAILYGEELGLGPMQSLAKVAVVKGQPALYAEAARALVVAAGHEIWLEESTNTRAIAAGRRNGSDRVGRVTWTMDDAKRAGLAGQPNYTRYPREMLVARATGALAKQMFADVLGGVAVAEELEGEPGDNGPPPPALEPEGGAQPARPAARRRRTPPPPPEPAQDPAPAPPLDDPSPAAASQAPATPPAPADEQPDPPAPAEPPMTAAQGRQVFALMRDVGISDRDERLTFTIETIGRTIESSNDLTIGEASRLIEALIQRRDNPPDATSAPVSPPDGPDAPSAAPEDAGPPDAPEAAQGADEEAVLTELQQMTDDGEPPPPGPVPYNEFPAGF